MIRVDAARLAADLAALARVGATPEGGVTRLAYSPEQDRARALVAGWMRDAGLVVREDAARNLIGRRDGRTSRRAIAVGSHLDTVPNGGRYDGALGVVAGLECARALAGHRLEHALEVIAFENEEGARRTGWLVGSRAMAGLLDAGELDRPDDDGVPLRARVPGLPDGARRSRGDFRAYLELHVEQGPVLEAAGCPIGVVEGITGRVSLEVAFHGAANHAGTTPMDARRDALVAAARLVLEVDRLVREEGLARVGTVGQLHVEPNALNIVPGLARLALELRDASDDALARVPDRIRRSAEAIAAGTGTTVEVRPLGTTRPVPTSEPVRAAIERAAAACGLRVRRMPSGAGHDALAMASLTEIGMLFVPSAGGVSHSPAEFTSPEACADGCNVLLHAILDVDRTSAPERKA